MNEWNNRELLLKFWMKEGKLHLRPLVLKICTHGTIGFVLVINDKVHHIHLKDAFY